MRVVEMYGEQARGRIVLVKTNNITARGTAEKLASRSADMQELLRRLLEQCEMYEIVLRVVHTPGARLLRPDRAPTRPGRRCMPADSDEHLSTGRRISAPNSESSVDVARRVGNWNWNRPRTPEPSLFFSWSGRSRTCNIQVRRRLITNSFTSAGSGVDSR